MKKQVTSIALCAAFIVATAASALAQGNGNAVGGGAAGGPNGTYQSQSGSQGNNNPTDSSK
jgi:hypothetical protein